MTKTFIRISLFATIGVAFATLLIAGISRTTTPDPIPNLSPAPTTTEITDPKKDPRNSYLWRDAPEDLDLGDGTQADVKQGMIEMVTSDPEQLALTTMHVSSYTDYNLEALEETLASLGVPADANSIEKAEALATAFRDDPDLFDRFSTEYRDFLSDPNISLSFAGE